MAPIHRGPFTEVHSLGPTHWGLFTGAHAPRVYSRQRHLEGGPAFPSAALPAA